MGSSEREARSKGYGIGNDREVGGNKPAPDFDKLKVMTPSQSRAVIAIWNMGAGQR